MQESLLSNNSNNIKSGSLSIPKTEQNGEVHINVFNTRG